MKRMLFTLVTVLFSVVLHAQSNRLLDQPMQIRKIAMKVEADCFTAVTFLEIEFYNPNDKEIEGLYRFNLLPGQVVTAFQLELNGNYRDGSIEEKWKATNAYNTIVGKRIDPALLTLEYGNSYRLNIYPVPAKSSRRITMTIHQTLKDEKGQLFYHFAFNKKDTAKQFDLSIRTMGCAEPVTDDGLIANDKFQNKGNFNQLIRSKENTALWQGVRFYFPASGQTTYCTQTKNGQTYFALRAHHQVPDQIPLHPKRIQVYWDASGSSEKRNISKEINFLKQYVERHGIEELVITKFSDDPFFSMKFYPNYGKNWINYLQAIQYDGATRMDQLDFAKVSADAILLFSDGVISFGSKTFSPSTKPLFAFSSTTPDSIFLKALIGQSGGAFINLNNHSISAALEKTSFVTNQLISIESSTGKTIFEKTMRKGKDSFLVYGTLPEDDILTFTYGNNSSIYKTEKISLKTYTNCAAVGIDRLLMLHRFATLSQWYNWEDILEFGLKEKIVTYNTAYIVLERVEDYVKYNITPPKELEEECQQQGFITKDSKTQRQKLREADDYDILSGVVTVYNQKLKAWDGNSPPIILSRQEFEKPTFSIASNTEVFSDGALSGRVPGMSVSNMDEVVVTGYATSGRRELSFSTTTIQQDRLMGGTIEQALAGRVPGLEIIPSQGLVGSFDTRPQVRIRGNNSLSGNHQPLIVLDGFPVEGNINDLISVNNIESITVLKSPSAAAIYGSRGANGVILITSKKNRTYHRYPYGRYRFKDMEDVDYLKEIKTIAYTEKSNYYNLLRKKYTPDANFYVDIAQHFFESGLTEDACKILMNAAEVSNGDAYVLTAIGYTFENWKRFDKAAEVYKQLLSLQPDNLTLHHDLAWALYQQGKIQQAVETLYAAIRLNLETSEHYMKNMKASLLREMNAIISIYRDSLDLSKIPSSLITAMPVDLRIVLTSNLGYVYGMKITEPDGKECSSQKPVSKNGGKLEHNNSSYGYYDEYNIKKALKGKYRISISYNDYYRNPGLSMVRILCFKNFGRKDQSVSVENVIMNNQSGEVEIGSAGW